MPNFIRSLCLISALFLPGAAISATYQVDFSVLGSNNVIGTFQAPNGGGAVSNLMVTLSGVLFDTRTDAGGLFDYDPVAGDFVNYTAFPTYTNSIANALCGVGLCLLQIYPNPNNVVPGDYLAVDANLNNIDDGTKYAVNPTPVSSPVPLPPAVGLLGAALSGLLLLTGSRRKTRA